MDIIIQGIISAWYLIINGGGDIWQVAALTLQVSGTATAFSVAFGIPVGLWLALKEFPGKQAISSLVNFGMGLPPVVVGLVVSLFLWRYGPLGSLGIMYTPIAMVIAQTIIAFPNSCRIEFCRNHKS